MKLVRRARKSIRERRMKACIHDLQSNLAKVETRLFKAHKRVAEATRRARGLHAPVPADVLAGKMSPALYAIECRLHREAGLPRPAPYEGYAQDMATAHATTTTTTSTTGATAAAAAHRIGFVDFRAVVAAVRAAMRRRRGA